MKVTGKLFLVGRAKNLPIFIYTQKIMVAYVYNLDCTLPRLKDINIA